MHHFRNLLYVSHGTNDEAAGLKQALSLARNNNAALHVLVISPELPGDFPNEYKTKFEESLVAQTEASIEATKKAIKLDADIDMSIAILMNKMPAIKIVQHVLQHGQDLVIKEAEPHSDVSGFKALDMDLLRKCPVPVWLCHRIEHSRQNIRVAVALDPLDDESEAVNLAMDLLKISRALADDCSGELQIVSCWDYAREKDLKDNVFIKLSEDKIQQKVENARKSHLDALKSLVKKSGISGEQQIHHLRGKAEEQIPLLEKEQQIDILVMGTVARTGIPGLVFGNTAENTIQNLSCSLMALKPQGFVSPVKAYK